MAEGYRQETRSRPARGRVVSLVSSLALLSSCSSSERADPDPNVPALPATTVEAPTATTATKPIPTTTTTSRTPAVAPRPACELEESTLEDVRRYPGFVSLSSMVGEKPRVGDHDTKGECHESVVFPFRGNVKDSSEWPGVHARYVDAPIQEYPSAIPINVEGEAFLQVTIGSWTYGAQGGSGPKRITDPSLELVKEVVLTENHEGVTTWTVGVNEMVEIDLLEVRNTKTCPDMCVVVNFHDN